MNATPLPGRTIAHPRSAWIDPRDGAVLAPRALMETCAARQAVLLGESHDIAEIHRWQLHVIAHLHLLRPNLVVGFEMFPRRVQPVLDAWVAQSLTTAQFIEQSEWSRVWGFDPAIYLPIFHYCRQQGVPMLALNCERPLVSRVGQLGWDAIPVAERDSVTPSAPATDGYRAYLTRLMSGFQHRREPLFADPARFDRFIRAQQVWDRSFACAIADCLRVRPDALVVGVIGRGHLEYGHGVAYQLRDLGVEDVATLLPTPAESHDPATLEGIADALFRLDHPEPPSPRQELRPPAAVAP